MVPDTYRVDEEGHLWIGGISVASIAQQFGTPVYVLDHATLVHRLTAYQQALADRSVPGLVFYAAKAFIATPMARLLQEQGVGLDVVSGDELYTALSAGFNPAQIMFHGNVKTPDELAYALDAQVGWIAVDSLDELDELATLARERNQVASVVLRLTPGIEAHTHAFIRTGQFDSKFGFAMAEGISDEAVRRALSLPSIRLVGFHAHIGSQIFEIEPFLANAEALLRYSRYWYDEVGWWPDLLDIGGGFGARYTPDDTPPDPQDILSSVQVLFREWTPKGLTPPKLAVEPGRSIVAEAGVTVYTVRARKTAPGGHRYLAVDGGMGDNIRPALYQAQYRAEVDGKALSASRHTVTVVGRYCESGDVLIAAADLPDASVGDQIVVFATGAYNYAMASTYNRVPRPPVVLVREGKPHLWVRRETWADLVRLDGDSQ
jgi:diaminopimelate decarboxylase